MIEKKFLRITPIVAIDCEMVLTKARNDFKQKHELARLSIVNYNGHILFDEFIKPKNKVINYLTWVSGVTREKVENSKYYEFHHDKIMDILRDKIIIGHTLKSDYEALNYFPNPKKNRDLKTFKIFQENGNKILSLKKMAMAFLNIDIQKAEHSSVTDFFFLIHFTG